MAENIGEAEITVRPVIDKNGRWRRDLDTTIESAGGDSSGRFSQSFTTGLSDRFKRGMPGVGAALRTGFTAAIGAAGIASAVGAAAGGGLIALGNQFDEAFNTIRIGTGATGDQLAGLNDVFKQVASESPEAIGQVAGVVADLNTRLGLTGEPLAQFSDQMLDLARITGEDVNTLLENGTRVLGDWGVAGTDAAGVMDTLFRASQSTGIEVGALQGSLVQFGAPLRQFGFSIEESAALLGQFEKEGVNTELVMGSLRQGLGRLARDGEAPAEAFRRVISEIEGAGSVSEANLAAIELFGARAGPDMAAAISEGRFAIEDLVAGIENGGDTISALADETETASQKFSRFKNEATIALEPLASGALDAAFSVFERLSPHLSTIADQFGNLIDVWSDGDDVAQGTGEVIDAMFGNTGKLVDPVRTVTAWFMRFADVLRKQVIPFIQKRLIPALGDMWEWISKNIIPVIQDVVTVILDEVIPAIADLVAKFVDEAKPVIDDFKVTLEEDLMPAFIRIKDVIVDEVIPALANLIEWVSENVIPVLVSLVDYILNTVIPALVSFYATYLENLVQKFGQVVSIITEHVIPAVQSFVSWITDSLIPTVQSFASAVAGFFSTVTSTVEGFVGTIAGFIGQLASGFSGFVQSVGGFISGIASAVSGFASSIRSAVGSALEAIGTFVSNVGSALKDNPVTNFVKGVVDEITDLPGKITKAATGVFSAAKSVGSKLINGIKDGIGAVGGLATDIASAVGSAIRGFINRNIIDKINNALEFSFDIPFVGTQTINPPDIARLARGARIPATNGGVPAILAEAGVAEYAIPARNDPNTLGLIADLLAEISGGNSLNTGLTGDGASTNDGRTVNFTIVNPDPTAVADEVMSRLGLDRARSNGLVTV